MSTHLSQIIVAQLATSKRTGAALAREIGIHQTTVSRACAGERVSVESLRALCSKQVDQQAGLDCLIGHLHDEVERSGRSQTEVSIHLLEVAQMGDIQLLEEQARNDEELRNILRDLASMVRKIRAKEYPNWDEDRGLHVAEDPSSES
jgi:transposase-like protein